MWKGIRQAALWGGFACFAPVLAAGAQGKGNVGSITVGGNPGLLRINAATPGMEPNPAVAVTSYTVEAAKANKPQKVTGEIDMAMPAGVTLTIELSAPTGAASNGPVALDATARDLVGNIRNTNPELGTITYTLSTTVAVGVVTPQSRTVTLTVTSWP
jgi:hypothetical protein